jgi:alcohol dehydrogenase class IV
MINACSEVTRVTVITHEETDVKMMIASRFLVPYSISNAILLPMVMRFSAPGQCRRDYRIIQGACGKVIRFKGGINKELEPACFLHSGFFGVFRKSFSLYHAGMV